MDEAHVESLSEEGIRKLSEVTLEQTSHCVNVDVIRDHLRLQIIYTQGEINNNNNKKQERR